MAHRIVMLTTLWIGGLLVTAACEWPTQPTPPGTDVTVDITNTNTADGGTATGGDGAGGDGGEGGAGGEDDVGGEGDDSTGDPPSGPASIIASGTTADGDVLYQMGPGQVFARTGGDADTVWCRPASDCNGEGGNRTAVNAASPPAAWIEDASAVFRRSGSTGTTVTFTVDGVTLTHEF